MLKIVDVESEAINRGSIIRFFKNDESASLCLMVCEVVGEDYYQLMVVNGYKAGLSYWYLPEDSLPDNKIGVSKQWLINNYGKWKYMDYNLDSVFILSQPEAKFFNY